MMSHNQMWLKYLVKNYKYVKIVFGFFEKKGQKNKIGAKYLCFITFLLI